jgi:hypothetical protein
VTKINDGGIFWRVALDVGGSTDFLYAIALDQNAAAFDVMPAYNVQHSGRP